MRYLRKLQLWAGLVIAGLGGAVLFAQKPQPVPTVQAPATADSDTEVLARGPIHEAFATTGEMPTISPVVAKQPPSVIEELPPDQKPDGDNVLWIPGYWHYDEDRKDFIWISGFWRNAPAGRVWVPGDWREAKGGFQWVPGFWNVAAVKQQPAELEYLPPPPVEVIEAGPSVAAPHANCFYTPGCWVYKTNRYVWRPGYWVDHRPDWVWVPDHYRWTPVGYVFVPGYWDSPLDTRGVLFAPVYFRAAVIERPRFVYTPAYVVPASGLQTCLFVRSGYSAYYFGDYFEPRYVKSGYTSWAGVTVGGSNFAVSVGVSRTHYDPLWSYYSVQYRDTPAWHTNVTNVYVGRYKGDVPRPAPVVQTNVTNITNVTNVTNNNTTVVNNHAAPALVAPLADVQKSQAASFRKVAEDERVKEQKQAKELVQLGTERRKVETAMVDKGLAVTKDEKPRQAKLVVPEGVALRAQAPATPEKAPPPPAVAAKPIEKKPETTVAPMPAAKVAPPTVDPKTGAVTPAKKADTPAVPTTPAKPTDPAKPINPPTTPVVPTKPTDPVKPVTPPVIPTKPTEPTKPVTPPVKPTDPVKPPVETPKPKDPPKVDPPKVDPPKPPVVPTTPPTTPVKPPVELPKPVDPPKLPVVPPKPTEPVKPVEVPKPPTTPGVVPPKVDPPKIDPPKPPVLPTTPPPKVDPPKPPTTPPAQPTKPKDDKPKEKEKDKR